MKYKIGDKVKILRVGSIRDPEKSGWIDQVSKIKEANLSQNEGGYNYRLVNDFPAYEEELELVLEFKVGDRVRVTETAYPEDSRGKIGRIYQIDSQCRFYPFKVRFDEGGYGDGGWNYGYNDTEIERWEESGLSFKVIVPKTTRTITLLGKDGLFYNAEFVDISFEMFRSYMFPAENIPDGRVKQACLVRVDNPHWLYVAPSGSHRIIDKHGRSHYIPCGWKHLWWLVEDRCYDSSK